METGQKITIKKESGTANIIVIYFDIHKNKLNNLNLICNFKLLISGKIKANSAHIISANIPATNGVIHAVETLL